MKARKTKLSLEHNAQYARECIAEVDKMVGGGE